MAEASALRKKEAAAFAKLSAASKADIEAVKKAIAALEKGMAGAFLQTSSGAVIRRLALTANLSNADRDMLTSFLTDGEKQGEGNGYAPQSGEIVGILKQMLDTMEGDLAEATAAEEEAIKIYKALMEAKTKEVEAATKAIESKLARIADLGVEIVQMKEDMDDTEKALMEDKKILGGPREELCGEEGGLGAPVENAGGGDSCDLGDHQDSQRRRR